MCGISGRIDLARHAAGTPWTQTEVHQAEQARDAMAHRGPDGSGLWQAPGVLLGHRRLAILDLSPGGQQPMLSASGTVLTFNGEIYNYLELREELALAGCTFRSTSDTEVLLAALDTWGLTATLPRLRGMYAFAWWQPDAARLDLARDPVGKKPLYYWADGDKLLFSSTLTALAGWLRALGVSLSADPVAIEHHLAAGYIPAPRTGFAEVRKLAAGESLALQAPMSPGQTAAGGVILRLQPAPPIAFADQPRALDSAGLDHLDALLQRAVARRLRSDVPVATFLSGGLDSSLVTALAARAQPGITAYTVRTPGRNDDEFQAACRVAQVTGVAHEVLELGTPQLDLLPQLAAHHGEPFGDSSAVPTWLIAALAGRRHRVVLTGDGGDEVQGGYSGARLFAVRQVIHDRLHVPHLPDVPMLSNRLAQVGERSGRAGALAFKALRLLGAGGLAISAQRDGLHHLHHLFAPELRPLLAREGWQALVRRRFAALAAKDELDRALGIDFSLYLPEDLCVKVDVASMAHAVETRAPLLDRDFTDASWQVRAQDRVRPHQSKRIIRALVDRHLPQGTVLKRKQGFTAPIDRWLLDASTLRLLTERYRAGLPGLDFLDGAALATLLRERADDSTLRWRLLFLAAWADMAFGA